jgi:hypothetical protein
MKLNGFYFYINKIQMDSRTAIVSAGILITAVAAAVWMKNMQKNTFNDDKLLELGLNTPTIWIYVDDTDVNSRWWADFGARSSRVYNLPFLNLCYQSIVNAAGDKYHVEVIGGLADAERRLGGLPEPMRNKRLPLRDEEMTYLKVAFLEKFGGLWMGPSTIAIKKFPELPNDNVVLFGSDPLETYAGSNGTFLPNQHALWSPKAHHPFFVQWHAILKERIERQATGKEIRNDKNWDILFVGTGKQNVIVMPHAELTRKQTGRKIELEDLLSTGQGGVLPFAIHPETIYIPFPWPELLERRIFGWFLRMSEEQILESDIVVTHIFKTAGI